MSHKMHKLQDDKTTVPLYFNSKIPFFFFFFRLFQNGSGSKQNGTLRFRFRFFEEKKIRLERVRFGSKQKQIGTSAVVLDPVVENKFCSSSSSSSRNQTWLFRENWSRTGYLTAG